MSSNTGHSKNSNQIDALVVGAGFSGLYQLHKLRVAGYSIKLFEAATTVGGTWHWNCYPGAHVDSEFSVYQYSIDEVWRDWNWTERFPDQKELLAYFEYVDKKLDLSRDIQFQTRVTAAQFDTTTDRWTVNTQNGITIHPQFLVLCTGSLSKPLFPNYKGLDTFKGEMHHTSLWPQGGVELRRKRIGVIGTGASGVQVIQEVGPEAAHLTVFQRTPNLVLPMRQRKVDIQTQDEMKEEVYPHLFRRREQTLTGFQFDAPRRSIFDVSPEERYLTLHELWKKGGFEWISAYGDIYRDLRANDELYRFWLKQVRARINDPEMQQKLAPTIAPYPIGAGRPSLEQRYFETFNLPHVDLIDLKVNPIDEVTPRGVRTQDGVEHELDVLVLATGFDAVTGSITQIDIHGIGGVSIRDRWAGGLSTYLGMMSAKFPNMFFVYGPHGPIAFANGPTCIEFQSNWIVDCIRHMRTNGHTRIEPIQEAEDAFVNEINRFYSKGLWSRVKSWSSGANVPGKRVESLNYTAGVPHYIRTCKESAEKGYQGFTFSAVGRGLVSNTHRARL